MTKQEFGEQIKRLVEVYPTHYSSQAKAELIFERIRDFEIEWFKRIVDKILLNGDPRFNFEESARNERNHRRTVEFTNNVTSTIDGLKAHMSDEGFQKVLKEFNAESAWDAVQKNRRVK